MNSDSNPLPISPYPGLRPFQEDEAAIFFGRGDQVSQIFTRLESHRFLAVVGPSASGKSSLVRAGLLPEIEGLMKVSSSDKWKKFVVRLRDAPLLNLAYELSNVLRPSERGPEPNYVAYLRAILHSKPQGLIDILDSEHVGRDVNVLIVIDQFEDLFRSRRRRPTPRQTIHQSTMTPHDEAAALVSLLLYTAAQTDRPIYVVVTLQSDFLGDCNAFHGLPDEMSKSQFLVPPLTREQARDAIVEPAQLFDGEVDPDLLTRLQNEMGNYPDQLPLMQCVLMCLWEQAKSRGEPIVMRLDDYEPLGGLRKALSIHADRLLKELAPSASEHRLAEILFRSLCDREERLTSRMATVSEIAKSANVKATEVIRVADTFRQPGRTLLLPSLMTALTEDSTLDISHESLIRQWDTLQRLVERTVRDKVFVSYSSLDIEWLEKLKTHLKPYVRSGSMSVWDDQQISVGAEWRIAIENALSAAKVAVLLVSPNFLASDFIVQNELTPLLNAARSRGVTIFWIAVSSSAYEEIGIDAYQAAIDPQKPLDSLSGPDQNKVFVRIGKKLKAALDS